MELVAPSSLFKCSSSHTPKSRLRVFPQKSLNFSMHHHLHNLKPMESHTTTKISCFSQIGEDNGSPSTISLTGRIGEVKKVTKETNVQVKINLDGSGTSDCDTGIPFLDHMLDQLSSHGLFDVNVKAIADIHVDDHHTNEDIALTLLQALGDWTGINWFGDFSAPLDEALVHVALIYLESGRPHLGYDLRIPADRVGKYDTQLVEHFFQSIVNTSGMTLHIRQLAGKNSHHIIEATFKAFTRALRQATECDPRRRGSVPRGKCHVDASN